MKQFVRLLLVLCMATAALGCFGCSALIQGSPSAVVSQLQHQTNIDNASIAVTGYPISILPNQGITIVTLADMRESQEGNQSPKETVVCYFIGSQNNIELLDADSEVTIRGQIQAVSETQVVLSN